MLVLSLALLGVSEPGARRWHEYEGIEGHGTLRAGGDDTGDGNHHALKSGSLSSNTCPVEPPGEGYPGEIC
jgi:hypothetical protein